MVSSQLIDPAITDYIRTINNFSFVQSIFSCQGHYCKNIHNPVMFYLKKNKDTDRHREFGGISSSSRVKFPMILLKFRDKSWARNYVRIWLRSRRKMCKNDIILYYFTPKRNLSYNIHTPSIVLTKFEKIYVSLSFLTGDFKGTRYYKRKKYMDKYIRSARKCLFDTVIDALDVTRKLK